MAFCSKCGSEIPDGMQFCSKCGAPVGGAAPVNYAATPEYDHTAEFDAQDISDNKVFAMACYLLGFVGIIVAILAAKDSAFVKFHVRESIKLSVCICLCALMFIVPFLGWFVGGICMLILAVVTIIQFFNVCAGKAKESAIIRGFGFLK